MDPVGALKDAIEAVDPEVILPCDDRAVGHLHQLHARAIQAGKSFARIAELIERSLGAPSSYPIVDSRIRLIDCAREEGIATPATRLVTSSQELRDGLADLPFPWVLKADGSWGGHGVRIAPNRIQAAQAFEHLARPLTTPRLIKRLVVDRDPYWLQSWWRSVKPAVVVQSHISGRPANCAVFCWKGELLAGLAVEVIAAQGVTGSATVVKIVDSPGMISAAERLAKRLQLSGIFGLDFMIEDGTNDLYLIEMNPRSTPLAHLQLGPGHDLIAALSAELLGPPVRQSLSVTGNPMIAYFPQAWRWDPKSDFLNSSFCDVPWEEPELVQDLLKMPWPDRGVLARISNYFRRQRFEDRASTRGGRFQAAIVTPSSSKDHGHHAGT